MHGPLPRAELARRLRLSPAALTRVTRELLDTAAIRPSASAPSGTGGRPGTPLEVALEEHEMVGLKVTGDEVYGVRTDALGQVRTSAKRRLESTDVTAVTATIVELVKEVADDAPVEGVGIGLAGAMARFDDRVRQSLYLGWDDVPLAAEVERACGVPTVISNDVRALTAGVHWSGPARGQDDFAVVTTGVGVGLGLVMEGRNIAGTGGKAGMIGHQRLGESGPLCSEGHRGCVEAYLTTAAITGAVAVAHSDPSMTLDRVCMLADAGDAAARRALGDAASALGVVIAGLVNTLDLPTVILAGDGLPAVMRAQPQLESSLTGHLDRNATLPDVKFLVSDFDEWARGAAVVACQWLLLEPPPSARSQGTRSRPQRGRNRDRPSRATAVGA